LGPPAPAELVEGLNARPFPLEALDPRSFVATAGRLSDGVVERIAREGREKFRLDLPRTPLPPLGPADFVAFSFLRKHLPFDHPFESIDGGMYFAGSEVPVLAFGVTGEATGEQRIHLLRQVRVLLGGGDDDSADLVVGLSPTGGSDEILLARVAPGPTLEASWKSVAERIAASGTREPSFNAVLRVPKIHFDIRHRFGEIVGARFRNPGFEEGRLVEATQSILFRLDERGAVLESEALLAVGGGLERQDRLVFDRPFLLALREAGKAEPYLLLWIANADLMPK
jgi:hypothetical protein